MTDLSYRASLKNPAVEEPVDLLVHRPLGYLLARLCFSTAITPDQLTVASMGVGVVSGALIASSIGTPGPGRLPLAAGLFVLSAVIDCSDGQLARMRGSSSRYGRMLDGAVDTVVQIAVAPAAIVHLSVREGVRAPWMGVAWAIAGALTILAGVRHTTLYDQYKNLWTRNTAERAGDCDDLEDLERDLAEARANGPLSWVDRARFSLYRTHLGLVASTLRAVDPAVPPRFRDMPPYSAEGAARYRALNASLMRAWSFFGVGTHIFMMSLALAFDRLEVYIVLRLVLFNLALLAIVPRQRAASRAFFQQSPSERA